MAQPVSQDPAPQDLFDWLRPGRRGPSYVSYASLSERSACGFEFGADGVAGCCNYGGELLQMAAPSAEKGLIFARGDFSHSLYTWVARSQRMNGGSSTFGLKMTTSKPDPDLDPERLKPVKGRKPEISDIRLGSITDRGCFNYRWPFAEYPLLRNDKKEEYNLVGTCFTLSFVKGGVLYQSLRLEQGTSALAEAGVSLIFPPQTNVALSIGGAVRFTDFETIKYDFRALPQQVSFSLEDNKRRAVIEVTQPDPESEDPQPDPELKDPRLGLRLEARVYLVKRVDHVNGADTGLEQSKTSWEPLEITQLLEEASWGETLEKQHTNDYPPFQVVYEVPKRSETTTKNREAVFVAAFKLMDSKAPKDNWNATLPHSEIHDYVTGPQERCENGSPESPLKAKSPLSETESPLLEAESPLLEAETPLLDDLFVDHMEQVAPFLGYTDISLISRCLERTLQVGTVPAFRKPSPSDDKPVANKEESPPDTKPVADKEESPSDAKSVPDKEKGLPLVLVSNLFMKPDVDLKSLFWKVRFLTKCHRLLWSLRAAGTNGSLVEARTEEQSRRIEQQSRRIKTHVKRLIQYLVNAFLHCEKSERPYLLLPDGIPAVANARYYYVLPAILCAVKAIPELDLDLTKLSILDKAELTHKDRLPDDSSTCAYWSQDTVLLLRWSHYESLLKLCTSEGQDWGRLVDSQSLASTKRKASKLRTTATLLSAAKLASDIPYSTKDEIFDRLASLAPELDFDGGDVVASLSTSRIRNRSPTKAINPGKPPDDEKSANLSSPWEVDALCHHSRLKAIDLGTGNAAQHKLCAGKQWNRGEVRLYKGKLYHFLNAEGTLVSTWERVSEEARRGLLRSETTAVVASTFLDLYQALLDTWRSTDAAAGQKSKQRQHKDVMQELSCKSDAVARHGESNEETASTEQDGHSSSSWSRLAPRRIYHPPDFINSLDDTPELYRPKKLRKIPVPVALHDYYTKPKKALTEKDIIAVPDLNRLFIVDIVPSGSARYLGMNKPVDEKSEWKRSLGVEPMSKANWKEDLTWRLHDSLVDQDVCHRFLRVAWSFRPEFQTQSTESKMYKHEPDRMSKEIMTMLMYIAHPEAIGCLDSHIRKAARFVLVQHRTMWLARITLRSWKMFEPPSDTSNPPPPGTSIPLSDTSDPLSDTSDPLSDTSDPLSDTSDSLSDTSDPLSDTSDSLSDTSDPPSDTRDPETYNQPIRIPRNLQKPFKDLKGYKGKENQEFHLQVSSFVITTTALGDFSKCTIISDFINEKQLEKLAEKSCDIWEEFVHQPQTARCLVFLLVLQELCNIIAIDYEKAINHFSGMVSLEDCFEAEGWEENTGVHGKFQLGLWSFNSLSILQVSLEESVNSIQEAKKQLLAQIKQGPETRSQTLESMCERSLVQFEAALARLTGVNDRLKSRTTLSGHSKDALSTILDLRDGETSVKQNAIALDHSRIAIGQSRTIQKLTYLTIVYLPLSLVAALLSIDGNRAVTPSDGGTMWYVEISMALLVGTLALAAGIDTIVNFFVWPHQKLQELEQLKNLKLLEKMEQLKKSEQFEKLVQLKLELLKKMERLKKSGQFKKLEQLKKLEKPSMTSAAAEPAEVERLRGQYNLWLWLLRPGIAISSICALWHGLKRSLIFIWGCLKEIFKSFMACCPREGDVERQ